MLNQNLKLALNNKNNDIIVNFYRLLGDNYGYQDSIAKSLIDYKKAIPYLSQKKSEAKSRFFQRISDQYTKLNQNNKALFYIDLAIENIHCALKTKSHLCSLWCFPFCICHF